MNPHIEENKIIDFLGGNLPSPEKTAIEDHFAGCCECAASLREAQEGDIFLKTLKIKPDPNLENLQFRILETISTPTMGEVGRFRPDGEAFKAPTPTMGEVGGPQGCHFRLEGEVFKDPSSEKKDRPVPQPPSNWKWLSDFSLAFTIIIGITFGYMNLIKKPQPPIEKPTVSRAKYQAVSPFTSFSKLTPGTPDKKFSPSKILGNEGAPGSKNLISRFSPQGTSFKIIK